MGAQALHPQQIARHLLDPQWRNRDYNALDELVEMTHDADLSSLDEDDLETLAASGLPELRQAVIRYAGTPARLFEDMARTESNTRLLQMLVESGKLSQNAIDLCCWNQTDSRLAASMLTKASDDLLHRLSGRDWWPSRKNAVESGRLDRKDLDDMIKTENHPDVVSALIGTGEFDMDSEVNAIRRVITSPGLLTTYTNPMNRRYSLDLPRREVVRQAARTMLEHAPVGMILSMPDDDDENWRTLIDTAATEYVDEISPNMLALIVQSEGNDQVKSHPRRTPGKDKDMSSGADEDQMPTASPGTDGTYGFNLRLPDDSRDDVVSFPRTIPCGEIPVGRQRGRADRETPRDRRDHQAGRPSRMVHHRMDRSNRTGDEDTGGRRDRRRPSTPRCPASTPRSRTRSSDTSTRTTRTRGPTRTARASSPDTRSPTASETARPCPTGSTGSTTRVWSTKAPKVTVKELVQMREGIFDSLTPGTPFGTTPSTPRRREGRREGRRTRGKQSDRRSCSHRCLQTTACRKEL